MHKKVLALLKVPKRVPFLQKVLNKVLWKVFQKGAFSYTVFGSTKLSWAMLVVLTFDIGWGLVPGYYCLNEHSRKQKWMLMLEYSSFIFFSAVQFIKICGGNLYKKTAERLRLGTLAALINWRLVSNHRIIFFNIISWL